MTLAEWIEERMQGRSWSQRALARRIEVSPAEANDILRKGHIPSLEILNRIAKAFDAPLALVLQLCGYSVREKETEATRVARLLDGSPLLSELWDELVSASPDHIERTLSYVRFLKSS